MSSDLRLALRQLKQHPGFVMVAVLTLAIGIGANTALFSVVNAVLLRPLPFPKFERLVTVWEKNPALGIDQQRIAPLTLADWQPQTRSFAGVGFWTGAEEFNLLM